MVAENKIHKLTLNDIEKYLNENQDSWNKRMDSEDNVYCIYNIKFSMDNRKMFMNLDMLNILNQKPEKKDYEIVYVNKINNPNRKSSIYDFLENLFTEFNINHPSDFYGHSMSVSDVVCVKENNKKKYYFVDSFGFKELNDWK